MTETRFHSRPEQIRCTLAPRTAATIAVHGNDGLGHVLDGIASVQAARVRKGGPTSLRASRVREMRARSMAAATVIAEGPGCRA
jgi:hypothetical protein